MKLHNNRGPGGGSLKGNAGCKAETLQPDVNSPLCENSMQEHFHFTTGNLKHIFRTSAFFGGTVSRFIRFGGSGDTSQVIAAALLRGDVISPRDQYGQIGGCWHCQKEWMDVVEGWLTWTPQTGRALMYGVCFPCHRDWQNADMFSRVLIEQKAQANLIRHYVGMEVAA